MDDGVQGTVQNMARQYYEGLYTRDQDTKAQPHTWKFPKLEKFCFLVELQSDGLWSKTSDDADRGS